MTCPGGALKRQTADVMCCGAACSLLPAEMWLSGARSSSSWVAYEPVHKVHRAGGEDLHVWRSPRRPRDTTWSSSLSTAFARKVVRVRRVACRVTRVVALSRSLAGETARKPRHARRRERRAARANVKASESTVKVGFAVTRVGEFCRSIWKISIAMANCFHAQV